MNGLRAAIVAAMLLALPASASAKVSFFHSPSGNIECQLSDHYAGQTSAYCETLQPARAVTMGPAGGLKVCNGQACLSDGPENAFTLGYGHAVRVGPFRCTSRTSGMTCRVIGKGRGFVISRSGLRRF